MSNESLISWMSKLKFYKNPWKHTKVRESSKFEEVKPIQISLIYCRKHLDWRCIYKTFFYMKRKKEVDIIYIYIYIYIYI